MLKGLFRRKRFVGLDVGSSSVKAIELSGRGDHLILTGLGIESLAPDTVVDGQIFNREEMAGAIAKLFRQNHPRRQRLATAVGGYRTILKSIVLPPMTEEELSESIDWHAEEHIPYDISDVRLSYQTIASTEDSLSVMLAACKKELIQNLEETIKLAGQQADIVDFEALALQNCYTSNYQPSDDSVVALVHIGASGMIIHVLKGRQYKYTRDASAGGNYYTDQIQRELGLTFAQAEAMKLGGTRELEIEETEIHAAAEAIARRLTFDTDFERLTEATSHLFENEISRTLDFYRATSEAEEEIVQKILISGGGSKLKGFRERLARSLDIPVEPLDSFRRIKIKERRFSSDYLRDIAPEMAVAVGLALRSSTASMKGINLAEGAAERKRDEVSSIKESGKKRRRKATGVYLYQGRNRLGETIVGERAAENEESLRELLRREQIILTSAHGESPKPFSFRFEWRRKKVSLSELENFTRRYLIMLDMGSPIMSCLEALALETKNKYFSQTLGEIISAVDRGSTLYAAMELHPKVFDDYFVNLFQAGESLEMYDRVLPRLLTELESRLEWRRRIKLALLYPASLLAAAFVTMMLMVSTAPGEGFWARGFTATGLWLSVIGGVLILATVIVAVLLSRIYKRKQDGRRQIDALLLRIPFLGPLLHKYSLARFARMMSTLLSSGIPYMTAFDVTIKGVGNSIFVEAIKEIRDAVYRGYGLADALNELFPQVVKQTMGIGEAMGGIDAALGKVADLSELELSRAISRLPFVLLPLAILLLILIAGIMLLVR